MKTVFYDVDITADKPFCLIPVSDCHVGHAGHDKKFAKKTIDWIKKKGASVILLGDMVDGISPQDKRFEKDSIAKEYHPHLDNLHYKQVEGFLNMVEPIKKQIICTLSGNHEDSIKKYYSYDAAHNIADALKVPLLGDPGYVMLRCHMGANTQIIPIFCSHGHFMGGRLRGAKVNAMERLAESFDARIFLCGHTHDLWVSKRIMKVPTKNGKIVSQKRFFINTGSFVRLYGDGDESSWASRKVFPPVDPGVARCDFYAKRTENGSKYTDIHVRA